MYGSRFTVKDLQKEVDRLNDKYCKGKHNHLVVNPHNGGYSVELTGNLDDYGNYYGLHSGCVSIVEGNQSARECCNDLWRADSRGWVKNTVNSYEKAYGSNKVRYYNPHAKK